MKAEKNKELSKAIMISNTAVAGNYKVRWECPICRKNKEPECRFNLSHKKTGLSHKCRFCKTELLLEK
jgi:hypothetical protein